MQMQGEPVTLTNIEHNVKEKLNVNESEENLFIKILLLPSFISTPVTPAWSNPVPVNVKLIPVPPSDILKVVTVGATAVGVVVGGDHAKPEDVTEPAVGNV